MIHNKVTFKLSVVLFTMLAILSSPCFGYDRKAALYYADSWSKNYDPEKKHEGVVNSFFGEIVKSNGEPGNDCTNFVSQALLAGNIRFDKSGGYLVKGVLVRADELGQDLLNHHVNPYADKYVDYTTTDLPNNLPVGDVLFVVSDPRFKLFRLDKEHAMILVGANADGNLSYNAHTVWRKQKAVKEILLKGYSLDPLIQWPPDLPGHEFLRYFPIPDSPIIKYMQLTQKQNCGEVVIHEYKYDADYDPTNTVLYHKFLPNADGTESDIEDGSVKPYYSNTYNGLTPVPEESGGKFGPHGNPNVAKLDGELHLRIIFDTEMQTSNITVTFGKESPFGKVRFTTVGWSKTIHDHDTWEGKVDAENIPKDGSVTGINTIGVEALGRDGSEIDKDGKLDVYNPGPDTMHRFIIKSSSTPQVVATIPEAEPVQPNYWKAKEPVDVTSPVQLFFSDAMFDVSSPSFSTFITSLKIEEWGKIKIKDMSEEELKTWCVGEDGNVGHIKDGLCEGWIDLERLAPIAFWDATKTEEACGGTTEAWFDYGGHTDLQTMISERLPRLLRYDRKYRVTVVTDDKTTPEIDGAASVAGAPLDGNANGIVDGRPDDNFTLEFQTKKPRAVMVVNTIVNELGGLYAGIPGVGDTLLTRFASVACQKGRFLSFWVAGGDSCKISSPYHDLELKNLNPRKEYFTAGLKDRKDDPECDPKTGKCQCDWQVGMCPNNKPDPLDTVFPSDNLKEPPPFLLLPELDTVAPLMGNDLKKWGKLSVFSWDCCGKITDTLGAYIMEPRRKKNEDGSSPGDEDNHCLVSGESGEGCKAFGELLEADDEKAVDKFPTTSQFSGPVAAAGDNAPDESQSVTTTITSASWNLGDADVFVGANGFYKDTAALLERFSVKKFPMEVEAIGPELLKYRKVVVLPSASLSGYDTSEFIKTQFAQFVQNGGILVMFSQQHGSEYGVLPGGEVSGAGYSEDISCYTAGSFLDQYHPILAGQKDSVFDGGIDGYFLTWPQESTILIRRKKNNMPALIVYPYGRGFVVASTLYTDFAGKTGQLTDDETQLLKDLMVLLKNPEASFPEAKAGQNITFTLPLHNGTTQDANHVMITVADNMGQTVSDATVSVFVPAGKIVPYEYTFTAPNILGNYTAQYTLLFDTQTIQSPIVNTPFSVTEHIQSTTTVPDLQFAVTAPGDLFPLGSPITFTIHIKNNGQTSRTLNLFYISHPHPYAGPIGTITVPAQSETTFPYTTSNVYFYAYIDFINKVAANRWDFYIQVEDNQGKSIIGGWDRQYLVQGLAYSPSLSASMTLDKKTYGVSKAGIATLTLKNTTAGPFSTDITFSILNPNNQKIYNTTKTGISFAGSEQKTEQIPFTLPDSVPPGAYTVQASIKRDGIEIGKATSYFIVEKVKIVITNTMSSIIPSASNTILFNLKNTGQIDINNGNFQLSVKEPEGVVFFANSQPFTLAVDEQKTLSFSVPFPALNFGIYKLSYSVTTDTGSILGSFSLNAQPVLTLTTDKPRYKGGETAIMSLSVANTDQFQMTFPITLSVPSVFFTQTQNVNLGAKEQKMLTFNVPITSTAFEGVNPITVTATATKTLTQNFSLVVMPTNFSITLDKFDYAPGDTGTLTVTNIGGLDANVNATLTLADTNAVSVQNTTSSFTLPAGASKPLTFSFSDTTLVSDVYRLSLLLKGSTLKVPYEQYVTFQNEASGATLVLSPTKTVYSKGETPTMDTKITPKGILSDAKLSVRVFLPKSNFSLYSQVGSTASLLVDPPYIWFGTVTQGVRRLDTRTNAFSDFLPNTYIYALASDAAYVYMGTKDALKRYDITSGQIQSFTVKNIRALYNDGSFLWIGTDTGLKKWDKVNELVTESYTTQNGLPDNAIYSLLVDGTRVYVGLLNKGVSILDKLTKTFSFLTKGSGLPDERIRGLALDVDGIWVATWGGVVKLSRDGQIVQTFTTNEGLADNFVFSVAVDGDMLWVGTLAGLSQYDKNAGTWKNFTAEDGLPPGYVRSLGVDSENVYLGVFTK